MHRLETPSRSLCRGSGMTIVCTMREAPTRGQDMGPSRVRTHQWARGRVRSSRCSRPPDLAICGCCFLARPIWPCRAYCTGRIVQRTDFTANNVVMSSVESCFSRRLAQSRAETFQLMVKCCPRTPDTAKADSILDCSIPGRDQARRSFGSGGPRQGFFLIVYL